MVMVGIRSYGSPISSVSAEPESLFASASVNVKSAVSTGSHESPAVKEIVASSKPVSYTHLTLPTKA